MATTTEANRSVAIRFIEGFNTDDWDTVQEVVAPSFVFHHPDSGTVEAGPAGMVSAWSGFKTALPDSWHPIPVMIAEGDHVAVLLPTYGHFTGAAYHGIPPTGEWLEYGMVNMVRLRQGKIEEAWFGMDSLAEKQQMGAAPGSPPHQYSDLEQSHLDRFREMNDGESAEFDTLTAFGDVVVALGPPQHAPDTKRRTLRIYRSDGSRLALSRSHEFPTFPPFNGDLSADTNKSRSVVTSFFQEVLIGHDFAALARLSSPDILIHATALPCEASFFGLGGAGCWLDLQWTAFPDLTVDDYFTVAHGDIVAVRWEARGTSRGPFMMAPPSGAPVTFTGLSMYRIEEDRIAEIWEARNTLGILNQLNPERTHHHEQPR